MKNSKAFHAITQRPLMLALLAVFAAGCATPEYVAQPSAPVTAVAECRNCREPLPADPELRFCPACGIDQTLEPCAACGSPMRQEWNFCIRCGQRRDPRAYAG